MIIETRQIKEIYLILKNRIKMMQPNKNDNICFAFSSLKMSCIRHKKLRYCGVMYKMVLHDFYILRTCSARTVVNYLLHTIFEGSVQQDDLPISHVVRAIR